MKKWLLSIFCALSLIQTMAQPNIHWSENFSDGLKGWTVQTSACGLISGPAIGSWNLLSVSFDGQAVNNVTGRLDISSTLEYSSYVKVGAAEAYVQSHYTSAAGVVTSALNSVTLTTGQLAYGNDALKTLWYTDINLDNADLISWAPTVFGIGNPVVAVNGNTLTITSADALTVATYERVGNCGGLWRWSHNGGVGVGIFAPDALAITSSSAANGAVLVNADYLSTLGISGNIPSGPPYPQYITELISPVIDLSGVQNAVSIRFYELVRLLNLASGAPTDAGGTGLRTSFAVSTDGGQTWSDPVNANEGVAVNAPPLNVQREFPVSGLQGQSNVRIKFTFAADFYYWVLDDIAIVDRIPYDMQANSNFFAVTPNTATPISQVEPVAFLCDIQNNGGRTAENVELTLTITNNTAGSVVYQDVNEYGNVGPDVIIENVIFEEFLDPGNLDVGEYTGRYVISHDSTDLNHANDTLKWNFLVTDTLFSKELGATRNVAPASDPNYTYGNVYYTPNGAGYYARYTTFGVANADDLVGRSLTTFLYRWEGDTNEDGQANPEEYIPIAFNSYVFDGTESNALITIPVDLDGNAIELEDNVYYIAAVQYSTTDDVDCFLLASTALDYQAMFFASDSLGNPRYASVLEVGNNDNPELSIVGFGFDFVPVVRMSIGNNPDIEGPAITDVDETLVAVNLAELFPNPTSDQVNVKLDLSQPSDVRITITQVDGRVVQVRNFDKVQQDTLQLDVHNLASGQYFVSISTEFGTNVKPLIIKD